jgi:predicted transcriptional regulator
MTYSQMPVRKPEQQKAIGSLTDTQLMSADDTNQPVKSAMERPFVTARPSTSRAAVAELLRGDIGAVLVTDGDTGNVRGIITKFDLI